MVVPAQVFVGCCSCLGIHWLSGHCGCVPVLISCLVLSVYWPTLLVKSNGQGWVRVLLGC
ncbi:hypothetical protein NP493_3145g00000 [Ridgeia piscesae]|uniref:Uncharacterized protein n=1 Tax=Ridgeia piscesae TaxID=27915 RepID=A0AAD9J941_RIDPI|nr:hypothetical protein NP493_3145g00000 [Ridgeia piscesae]